MACVPCAIEMEPKTLSPGQINHVREQAVEAIQKMEPQKSSDVFVKEMEPIITEDDRGNSGIVEDNMIEECTKDKKIKMEKSRLCLCASILIKSPEEVSQGEPLTAPF